jgi:N-acetylglucosaminyldiphosphoundecaprenol N-acetyl-beta-D-mannosaminyltransferase
MYLRDGEPVWPSGTEATSSVATVSPLRPQSPAAPWPRLPRIVMQGVTMHAIGEKLCIEYILGQLQSGRGGCVVTPNVDHLRRCRRDLSYSAVLAEADLVVADGMPLVWASRLLGTPLPERVAGSDLISSLSAAAAGQGRSVFLLGGAPGTAEAAAQILRNRYPQLKVAGVLCPPVGFERDETQRQRIIAELQNVRPDIVFVALGSPKQERLIDQIRRSLPNTWWLGVGVSFSFLSGEMRRAPLWMRKWGLEWVHRLLQEPKRLFKRYVVVGIPYAMVLLAISAGQGIANRVLWWRPRPGSELPDEPFSPPSAQDAPSESSAVSAQVLEPIRANANGPSRSRQFESSTRGELRGLVLLGGGVRQSQLAGAIGRSLMDLPVGNGKTVLTHWLEGAEELARSLGSERLAVRLLLDQQASEPRSGSAERYRLERDRSEYRGTAGLLSSIAADYDDEDLILVGNAAQVLLEPLSELMTALKATGGEVAVVGHRDGTPSGLMLVTCRALRLIPPEGFVDMKEQALPIIASKYDVRVLQRRRPTGMPIRLLSDYISALRALHEPEGPTASSDPLAEDWKPTFVLVEAGASVAPTARIHDSVILAGATLEAGAVAVRSVVAGVVRKDRDAVDQCVEANNGIARNGKARSRR